MVRREWADSALPSAGRNTASAAENASGPLSRSTPMAETVFPVEMAAMVSIRCFLSAA